MLLGRKSGQNKGSKAEVSELLGKSKQSEGKSNKRQSQGG